MHATKPCRAEASQWQGFDSREIDLPIEEIPFFRKRKCPPQLVISWHNIHKLHKITCFPKSLFLPKATRIFMLKMSESEPQQGEWTDEELAITLFFASCQVYHSTISMILERHGYQRTARAISLKLMSFSRLPLRINTGQWCRQSINEWILNRFTLAEASRLIVLGKEEQGLIATVR